MMTANGQKGQLFYEDIFGETLVAEGGFEPPTSGL